MDTVTRAAMAVVLAEEGGIGVIDRGFRAGDIAPQVAEVVDGQAHAARRHPAIRMRSARTRRSATRVRLMKQTGVGTLAVVDATGRLEGPADRARRPLRAARRDASPSA